MNSLRVIVLLASLLVATSLAADVIYELPLQGCSGILVPLETDHILVNFNGSRMAFHTSDSATGAFDTSSALYFQWTDIREMVRGTQGVNADIDSSVNIQALSGCFCSFSAISRISDGIEETGVETTLTRCPNNPTLVAKAFVTVSNDTWFETYGPTMEGSSIEYFNYTHPGKGIKFGFSISNWTWTNDTTKYGQTYIAGGFQLGFDTQKALQVSQLIKPQAYIMDAQFGTATFQMTMELGYLLNQIPTVIAGNRPEFPISMPTGTGGFLGINWPMAFVQPNNKYGLLERWDDIYYDPSLTVFFGDSALSPTASKADRKTWVVGVAVAIPIAVILIVSVVLIVFFVPAVRHAVMPYRDARRKVGASNGPKADAATSSSGGLLDNGAESSSSSVEDGGAGWKTAAKPKNA